MSWFPVDDAFYAHPKVLATSLAARGLWVTAGAWSSAHLTDGAVPDNALAVLGGTPELADELVTSGLWRRTRRGYVFHDWLQWGSKRTADQTRALRETRAAAGRKGGLNSGKTRSKTKQLASPLPRDRLNPNTNTKKQPLTPPPDGGRAPCARHQTTTGQPGANCRACGTNPRGPTPPSPAERHPSARPLHEAIAAATPDYQETA